MTVNIVRIDDTWQVHFTGLLTILQGIMQNAGTTLAARQTSLMRKAVHIWKSQADIWQTLSTFEPSDIDKTWLVLIVVKLQLRNLLSEMHTNFDTSKRPRKLDIQKLRISARTVHRNLLLIRPILPRQLYGNTSIRYAYETEAAVKNSVFLIWNEYWATIIITADLLLRTGEYLSSCIAYAQEHERNKLNDTIREASSGIYNCVVYHWFDSTTYLPLNGNSSSTSGNMMLGLLFLWPLHCAKEAPGILMHQREGIEQMLWSIGTETRLPKAMMLV